MLYDVSLLHLLHIAVLLVIHVHSLDVDPKGYILYCPCMGRFGNQMDHFLGSLSFAKALDRTLVLPPWVEYHWPKPRSVQVPFKTYFKVEPLLEYHRVITMEKFMSELAPTLWPPGNRTVFCYQERGEGKGCNAKDGNPFGPFWDTFDVDFDHSEFFYPLYHDTTSNRDIKEWMERYPGDKWPVIAFTGAPAPFPVRPENAIHVL